MLATTLSTRASARGTPPQVNLRPRNAGIVHILNASFYYLHRLNASFYYFARLNVFLSRVRAKLTALWGTSSNHSINTSCETRVWGDEWHPRRSSPRARPGREGRSEHACHHGGHVSYHHGGHVSCGGCHAPTAQREHADNFRTRGWQGCTWRPGGAVRVSQGSARYRD